MEVAGMGQGQIMADRTQSSRLSGDAVAMLPTSRHTLRFILIGLRLAWALQPDGTALECHACPLLTKDAVRTAF